MDVRTDGYTYIMDGSMDKVRVIADFANSVGKVNYKKKIKYKNQIHEFL